MHYPWYNIPDDNIKKSGTFAENIRVSLGCQKGKKYLQVWGGDALTNLGVSFNDFLNLFSLV